MGNFTGLALAGNLGVMDLIAEGVRRDFFLEDDLVHDATHRLRSVARISCKAAGVSKLERGIRIRFVVILSVGLPDSFIQ